MTDVRFVERKGTGGSRGGVWKKKRWGHRGGKSTLIWSGKIEGWQSLHISFEPLGTYKKIKQKRDARDDERPLFGMEI